MIVNLTPTLSIVPSAVECVITFEGKTFIHLQNGNAFECELSQEQVVKNLFPMGDYPFKDTTEVLKED